MSDRLTPPATNSSPADATGLLDLLRKYQRGEAAVLSLVTITDLAGSAADRIDWLEKMLIDTQWKLIDRNAELFAARAELSAPSESALISEPVADLINAADRVCRKYGRDESGNDLDWTEWQDVRDAIRALKNTRETAGASSPAPEHVTGTSSAVSAEPALPYRKQREIEQAGQDGEDAARQAFGSFGDKLRAASGTASSGAVAPEGWYCKREKEHLLSRCAGCNCKFGEWEMAAADALEAVSSAVPAARLITRDEIVERVNGYFARIRKLGGDTGECDASFVADWLMWKEGEGNAEALSLPPAARLASGWIPVGERLPVSLEHVAIRISDKSVAIEDWVTCGYLHHGKDWWAGRPGNYDRLEGWTVTHWMPLPSGVSAKERTCSYCTSENPAIRSTYYDQTCEGCVKRMGKDG